MKYGKVLSMSIADENFGSCHQEVSSVKALLEPGAPKGQTSLYVKRKYYSLFKQRQFEKNVGHFHHTNWFKNHEVCKCRIKDIH